MIGFPAVIIFPGQPLHEQIRKYNFLIQMDTLLIFMGIPTNLFTQAFHFIANLAERLKQYLYLN